MPEAPHPILRVDPEGETPLYLQIVEQLRGHVAGGRLAPGAGLPSVRQLARILEVNPNTVSKAYRQLEAEGIIKGRLRRGCFVAAQAPAKARRALDAEFQDAIARLLSEGDRLGLAPGDLLQALRARLGGSQEAPESEGSDS